MVQQKAGNIINNRISQSADEALWAYLHDPHSSMDYDEALPLIVERSGLPLDNLVPFIMQGQVFEIAHRTWEPDWLVFAGQVDHMIERIRTMPVSEQQDGKGDGTIYYLRYERGGLDYYIAEKDAEGDGLHAAYGCYIYHGKTDRQNGVINIAEVVGRGWRLDFGFQPQTIDEILAAKAG